jgi:hypothetical protein
MSAVCERKRETNICRPFSVSDTVLAIPGMNRYIATKIALLDIEACHPMRMQPKRGSLCKEICRSCAHVMLSCTVRVRDALPRC